MALACSNKRRKLAGMQAGPPAVQAYQTIVVSDSDDDDDAAQHQHITPERELLSAAADDDNAAQHQHTDPERQLLLSAAEVPANAAVQPTSSQSLPVLPGTERAEQVSMCLRLLPADHAHTQGSVLCRTLQPRRHS